MPSGLADDNNLPVTHAPVVCGDAAPSEPPIRGEAAEGEAHTSSHNIKNNLNTMHGQPLVFNKPCRYGGCANIEPHKGSEVEGVLYLILEEDLCKLDKYEGYPDHYDRRRITVYTEEGSLEAWIYVAVKTEPGLKPSRKYMDYLIRGAEQHGLSQQYINFLKSFRKN